MIKVNTEEQRGGGGTTGAGPRRRRRKSSSSSSSSSTSEGGVSGAGTAAGEAESAEVGPRLWAERQTIRPMRNELVQPRTETTRKRTRGGGVTSLTGRTRLLVVAIVLDGRRRRFRFGQSDGAETQRQRQTHRRRAGHRPLAAVLLLLLEVLLHIVGWISFLKHLKDRDPSKN